MTIRRLAPNPIIMPYMDERMGSTSLLYSVAGEQGIAIAELRDDVP